MAEARVEDEEESLRDAREAGGARRNPRAPTASAASERADRNKPEQRQSSSQGALSSIRAVIKRTSNRTTPPTDQNRERRRPEITILAAEPLATNSWFPGASGAFPPPPPPAQPSWNGPVTVQLPPPSYEQVIREKSREQNTQTSSVSLSSSSSTPSPSSSLSSSSASAPRHTTIATQTDPETSEPPSSSKPQMRRPPKPPRPSLPLTPKPAEPVLAHTHSLIELDEPHPSSSTHMPTHPPSVAQCGVQTNFTHSPEPLTPSTPDSLNTTHNSQQQAPSKREVSARPRPRPRSKALPQPVIKEEPITREVKVQTLVRLKDNGTESIFAGFSDTSSDISSNKYLQDLLDVFGCDKQDFQSDQYDERDQSQKSDEERSVTSESCSVSTVPSEPLETIRPEPRPRTQNPQTPAKPSNPVQNVEETKITSAEKNKPEFHPVPAPRPLVKRSATSQQLGSSEEKPELRPPPRPPLAARMSRAFTQEDVAQPAEVPSTPSGTGGLEDQDSTTDSSGKPGAITPCNRAGGKCSAKTPSQKRPPPPTHTPVRTPAQDAVGSVSAGKSGPSLPHRPSEGRLLPLRPPPVKSSKSSGSQTPATNNQPTGYWGLKRGPPLPPRPKPGHPAYRESTKKIPQGNTKVTRPSRNPEGTYLQIEKLLVDLDDMVAPTTTPGAVKDHLQDLVSEEPVSQNSLELKKAPQTVEQPKSETNTTSIRYRARFAFDGEDGELTLRDGDVVVLVEYVNDEWGRGCLNDRTGLFPLNFVQLVEESPGKKSETPETHAPSVCVGEGQTGRALYDFTPESEDELCLKAGDVVSSLEEVDEEWFVGEYAGRRGIVPKNYIQVL